MVKIGKNTEGYISEPRQIYKRFRAIFGEKWQNTEVVIKLNINKKAVFTTTKNKKKLL
jgi:hypothetical protein